MRLSKTDVDKLATEGNVEEHTHFVNATLIYSIEVDELLTELSASFKDNQIKMKIPASDVKGWATNNIISFKASITVNEQHTLSLLVEKDFKCIDTTTEDQSDNYENIHKTC